jgi:uncharacterized protein
MTFSLIFFVLCCVLVTSVISGIVGMAGDALLLVLLTFKLLPIQQTLILYAVSLFFACAGRVFIHRKSLHTKSIEYYLVGLLFLFVFGSLPAIAIDKTGQTFLLGAGYLLLGSAFFVPFFSLKKITLDFSKPPQALLCSVIVNGLSSVDDRGFLLNLFFQDIPMTRYQVISTKAAALLIPYILVLAHASSNIFTAADMPLSLIWTCFAIIPVAILGSYLGKCVLDRITDLQFYKTTQIILWIMGAIYLGKGALLLTNVVPELMTTKRT